MSAYDKMVEHYVSGPHMNRDNELTSSQEVNQSPVLSAALNRDFEGDLSRGLSVSYCNCADARKLRTTEFMEVRTELQNREK